MKVIRADRREEALYYIDEWAGLSRPSRMRGDHGVIRNEKGRPLGCDHINSAGLLGSGPTDLF